MRAGGLWQSVGMTITLVKAWNGARDRLKAAGVDSPVIDARLLLEAAAGATRADIRKSVV